MTRLIIDGGTLTASRDNRTVSGLLVPFGEKCRSNLGRFSVDRGVFELPDDIGVLNATLDHQREQPVARFTAAVETDKGIEATFRVADGKVGDDLLAEIDSGKRRSLSVEARGVVVRAGRAIAGQVFGASFVPAGAFPSATLYAADAVDQPADALPADLPPDENSTSVTTEEITVNGQTYVRKTTSTYETETAPTTADPSAEEDTTVDNTTTTDATASSDTLNAALPGSLRRKPPAAPSTTLLAALRGKSITEAGTLMAALDVINQADALPSQQKQWLGEVYSSRTYQRRFANLVQHADLTGQTGIGWKFTAGKTPEVAPYIAGELPNSNEVKTEAVTLTAARLAGAGSVDRAWIDFPSDEFWAGYFREQTNSYERGVDGLSRDFYVANATAVVAGVVPDLVSTAAAYIVDGALAIIGAERDLPSWSIVGSDLYRELLLVRSEDTLAFLTAALQLDEGSLAGFKIVPSSAPALAGKVLVGTRTAATIYELPGTPVRVDTVSIANGQVDRGVFGYHAELCNDATGLALVAPAEG